MMTSNAKATKSKVRGYALIRDLNGIPLIETPVNCPDHVWQSLSKEHKDLVNSLVPSVHKNFI